MVVRRVDPAGPPVTRLPSVTSARLVRPATGRADLGVAQIQLRRPHRRFRRRHRRARLRDQREPGVHFFLGDRLRRDHALAPLRVALGQRQPGLGPGEVGLALVQRRLIGLGVDLEEHVALADLLALGERDAVEIARHPGTYVHGVDRLELALILVPLGQLFGLDLGDRHFGRRWRGEIAAATAAPCGPQQRQAGQYAVTHGTPPGNCLTAAISARPWAFARR